MMRNLKILGLGLTALMISAVWASGAWAHVFESEKEKTVITGSAHTKNHEVSYGGTTIVCSNVEMKGTAEGKEVSALTIRPSYKGCTFGGSAMEVKMNHCDFVFTGATVGSHAPVHLNCPAGVSVENVIPSLANCTMTMASQTTKEGVTYVNTGTGATRDITLSITAQFEVVRDNPGSNFFCGLHPASGTASYTANAIVKGFEDTGSPTTVEDAGTETTWTFPEGNQVGIFFK
jgi:hypothetical protein